MIVLRVHGRCHGHNLSFAATVELRERKGVETIALQPVGMVRNGITETVRESWERASSEIMLRDDLVGVRVPEWWIFSEIGLGVGARDDKD